MGGKNQKIELRWNLLSWFIIHIKFVYDKTMKKWLDQKQGPKHESIK